MKEDLAESTIHTRIDALADQWLATAERHEQRQLRAADGQPDSVAHRIAAEAAKQRAEIAAARTHAHHWLDNQTPDGTPLDNTRRAPLAKFAKVVTLAEIAGENDYNLNISRYVDAAEPPPQLDVAGELRKLRDLEAKRNAAEARMNQLLKELGYEE